MPALRKMRSSRDTPYFRKKILQIENMYAPVQHSTAHIKKSNSVAEKHELLPSATEWLAGRTHTLWLVNNTFLVL